MDTTLRNSLIASTAIHFAVLASLYHVGILAHHIKEKEIITVDYVILKEIAMAITTNREVVLKIPDAIRLDVTKEKETLAAKEKQAEEDKAHALKSRTEAHRRDAIKSIAQEAKKKTDITSRKDYADYYRFIREKLKSRLKENYKYYAREGDVYLTFTLNANGVLLSYNVDRSQSTLDEVLLHITGTSLEAVSPFPAIPKSLGRQSITFSIVISFRKE